MVSWLKVGTIFKGLITIIIKKSHQWLFILTDHSPSACLELACEKWLKAHAPCIPKDTSCGHLWFWEKSEFAQVFENHTVGQNLVNLVKKVILKYGCFLENGKVTLVTQNLPVWLKFPLYSLRYKLWSSTIKQSLIHFIYFCMAKRHVTVTLPMYLTTSQNVTIFTLFNLHEEDFIGTF